MMVKAFKENDNDFKKGFKHKWNIIDNVVSKAVQVYVEVKNIGIQLVELYNHQVNSEDREIHAYKNHLISELSSCYDNFPTILWSKLIRQFQDLLNMLRRSRVHPKVSSYYVWKGPSDFNRILFSSSGTKATIFNPPETRSSWGPRALDAWYISQSYNHYRW